MFVSHVTGRELEVSFLLAVPHDTGYLFASSPALSLRGASICVHSFGKTASQ